MGLSSLISAMAFSVESKSSRVLSLAIAVTFALCSAVDARTTSATTRAAERRCSVETGGKLTMFNHETTSVIVPCKFHLADFTCGDYRVKVTPGNAVGVDGRVSHDQVWVKVVNIVTKETAKLRTALVPLEKVEGGTVKKVWKIKEGNTDFLDFAGYDGGIARLAKDGVFSVRFSRNSVQVSCAAPEFSSRGVPETLCGDGSTVDEVNTARLALLGDTDLDVEQFLQYIILNDTTVHQSENCVALTTNFQGCSMKEKAVQKCSRFVSGPRFFQCLIGIGTSLEEVYDYCTRETCYHDKSRRPNISSCME